MTDRYWCPDHGWFLSPNGGAGLCPECGRHGEPPEDAPEDPPAAEDIA